VSRVRNADKLQYEAAQVSVGLAPNEEGVKDGEMRRFSSLSFKQGKIMSTVA
jgi:hypothetical protein